MTSCALTPTVGAQDEPLPLHDNLKQDAKALTISIAVDTWKTHLKKQVRSIIDACCVVS